MARLNVIEKFAENRKEWLGRGTQVWTEFHGKGTALVNDIQAQREKLAETGQRALAGFEQNVLTRTADLLDWAFITTGQRSDAIRKGRDFLRQRVSADSETDAEGNADESLESGLNGAENGAVETAPISDASTMPFEDYHDLNVKKIVARIADFDATALNQVGAYEAEYKGRKTVLQAVKRLLEEQASN